MGLPEMDLMLAVFSKQAIGADVEIGEIKDFNKLLDFSKRQSCFYLIADYLLNNTALPTDLKPKLTEQLEAGKYTFFAKYVFLVNLLQKFEKAGIKAVVLKGYSVARFYNFPFLRVSGDVDLLIDETQEKQAVSLLKANNFVRVHRRKPHEHHSCYKHAVYGILELHVKLFEDEISNVWFADSSSPLYVETKIKKATLANKSFPVLDDQSQILHVFFHIAKHFIENGISLRAMFDFALCCVNFKDTVDFDKIYGIIKNSGFEALYNTILCFSVKYCGFKETDFPKFNKVDDSFVSALYSDLVHGGWLGLFNTTSQIPMTEFACQKANKFNINEKHLNILKRDFWAVVRMFFPYKENLKNKFPYSAKYPLLLPVAFVHRYIVALRDKITGKRRRNSLLYSESNEFRRQILKKFELLD